MHASGAGGTPALPGRTARQLTDAYRRGDGYAVWLRRICHATPHPLMLRRLDPLASSALRPHIEGSR